MSSILDEKIREIEQALQIGSLDAGAVREAIEEYKNVGDKLRELLQYAVEQRPGDKEVGKYYREICERKASELAKELHRWGCQFRRKKDIAKAFTDQGYRLLEQVRTGKRDVVFHGILRIFASLKERMPLELVEAFKPVYPDEMFKVFLFSFLSGLLEQREQTEEKEEREGGE